MAYDTITEEYDQNGELTKTTKERQIRKTFWYWLQLLIIPAVLAFGAIGFSIKQNSDSLNLNNSQYTQSLHIAATRYVEDQHSALDQQQAAILQTYIDNIQDLLLNHNLLKSKPTDDVAILAQARTLTALQGLDAQRKAKVVQFLHEAYLIGFYDSFDSFPSRPPSNNKYKKSIFSLSGADLKGATLTGADLTGAVLRGADLSGADLKGATLTGADLTGAVLRGADLSGADLSGAYLNGAYLNGANLSSANLSSANLSSANLSGGKKVCTDLSGANLSGADLSGANLCDAIVTSEQLGKTKSLQGATMPDCLKHP